MHHQEYSFVDLFAGIGGLRLAFEGAGGQCIFTSEWNRFAQATYHANFDCSGHALAGDITRIPADAVPPHDLLLAGFPCQPFSLAGVGTRNKLGQKHGFADATQGTLFFEIARMLGYHRPKAFLLENVKNLIHHDAGKTFATIRDVLEKQLGYHVQYRVLNANGLVPQNRNRVFIIGFRERTAFDLSALQIRYPATLPTVGDILLPARQVPALFTLSDGYFAWVRQQAARNRARGNGFTTRYLSPQDTMPALIASYGSDRAFFIKQRGKNPRRLTPRECARAMGFPDEFAIVVSKTQAYRQFGNSVVVPLVAQIAAAMRPHLSQVTAWPFALYNPRHDRDALSCPADAVPAAVLAGGGCRAETLPAV
ncbi:MAG: DNA (cytosine-5-)-methyltransferase [Pseudomonadota bacterium]